MNGRWKIACLGQWTATGPRAVAYLRDEHLGGPLIGFSQYFSTWAEAVAFVDAAITDHSLATGGDQALVASGSKTGEGNE